MMMSLRQVRKPTMKKRAVATVMARVSVLNLQVVRVAGGADVADGNGQEVLLRAGCAMYRFKSNCFAGSCLLA